MVLNGLAPFKNGGDGSSPINSLQNKQGPVHIGPFGRRMKTKHIHLHFNAISYF